LVDFDPPEEVRKAKENQKQLISKEKKAIEKRKRQGERKLPSQGKRKIYSKIDIFFLFW